MDLLRSGLIYIYRTVPADLHHPSWCTTVVNYFSSGCPGLSLQPRLIYNSRDWSITVQASLLQFRLIWKSHGWLIASLADLLLSRIHRITVKAIYESADRVICNSSPDLQHSRLICYIPGSGRRVLAGLHHSSRSTRVQTDTHQLIYNSPDRSITVQADFEQSRVIYISLPSITVHEKLP